MSDKESDFQNFDDHPLRRESTVRNSSDKVIYDGRVKSAESILTRSKTYKINPEDPNINLGIFKKPSMKPWDIMYMVSSDHELQTRVFNLMSDDEIEEWADELVLNGLPIIQQIEDQNVNLGFEEVSFDLSGFQSLLNNYLELQQHNEEIDNEEKLNE